MIDEGDVVGDADVVSDADEPGFGAEIGGVYAAVFPDAYAHFAQGLDHGALRSVAQLEFAVESDYFSYRVYHTSHFQNP